MKSSTKVLQVNEIDSYSKIADANAPDNDSHS